LIVGASGIPFSKMGFESDAFESQLSRATLVIASLTQSRPRLGLALQMAQKDELKGISLPLPLRLHA